VAEQAKRRGPAAGGPTGKKRRPLLEAIGGRAPAADGEADEGLLHHRMRLGIISALAGVESLTFVELRTLLDTTDGNLSVHARKLEEAALVATTKSFSERRPRTEYRLTAAGVRALKQYLAHMEALISSTRTALER
jgi:DNA-binding MarR family transcriptional regulator